MFATSIKFTKTIDSLLMDLGSFGRFSYLCPKLCESDKIG